MKIGKILGSLSPAFGLLSGSGLFGSKAFGGLMGSMSPLYGAMSGKGLFGHLMDSLLGPHKKDEEEDQPQHNPAYAPQPMAQGGGGGMGINQGQNDYLANLMRGLSFTGPR